MELWSCQSRQPVHSNPPVNADACGRAAMHLVRRARAGYRARLACILMKPEAMFQRICDVAPGFKAVLAEHLRDNDELLSHLLTADLLRYVGARVGNRQGMEEVRRILEVLEEAFRSKDPDTENAIAVSFIEHIDTEPFFHQLEPLLGPALRAEYRRQTGAMNAR